MKAPGDKCDFLCCLFAGSLLACAAALLLLPWHGQRASPRQFRDGMVPLGGNLFAVYKDDGQWHKVRMGYGFDCRINLDHLRDFTCGVNTSEEDLGRYTP